MNLPNRLSLLRIALVPVMAVCFYINFDYGALLAVAVFLIAAFTDFLDGYIARKTNQITELGKLLDPVADKLLVAVALFMATGDIQGEEIDMKEEIEIKYYGYLRVNYYRKGAFYKRFQANCSS